MAVRPDTDTKSGAPRPDSQEGELEQYGVWVKAEPQDIAPEPESADEGRGLGSAAQAQEEEFELPEFGEGLPEESFLSAEEERLLGSFEDIKLEETSESLPPISDNFLPGEDFSLPDIEDLSALTAESLEPLREEKRAQDSPRDRRASVLPDEISPNSDIDMSSIVGLDTGEEEGSASSAPGPIEDVSAEFLDLSEPDSGVTPPQREASSAPSIDDVTAEFLDEEGKSSAEPAPRRSANEEPAQFEPLDIELHFDDLPSAGQAGKPGESGFEDLTEFDGILSGQAQPTAQDSNFDDLAAFEKELADTPSPAAAPRATPKASEQAPPSPAAAMGESPSLANELLLKIATELSSIRAELVTLKSQLASVKIEAPSAFAAPQGGAKAEASKAALSEEEEAAAGGFFDEEEDETIALTGDELDNILSSADFTEESPPEESAFENSELGEPLDILPETGDYSLNAEAPPIEEIRLEPEAVEIETPLPQAEKEGFGEIGSFADEGFPPLTEAPEDTSYLEEPLGSEQPLDLGESPLVEAPLVEPDLSELIVEEVGSEAELEISGELPAVEEEVLPDLTLEASPRAAPAQPSFEEEAEELEALAPIPEIEEFSLDEIKLAEETQHQELEEAESGTSLDFAEELLGEEAAKPGSRSASALPSQPAYSPQGESEALSALEAFPSLDTNFELPEEFGAAEAAEAAEAPSAEASSAEILGEEGLPAELEAEEILGETETLELGGQAEAAPERPEEGPDRLKSEIRSVLGYLDKLLESLPEEKIEEFAHSEHFETYKKLFEELGLV